MLLRIFLCMLLLSVIARLGKAQTDKKDSLIQLLQTKNDILRIDALNALAGMYVPDFLDTADEYGSKALTLAQKEGYTAGLLLAIKNKGLIAEYRGDLETAVSWYDRGIKKIGQNPQWQKELVGFYLNKGVAYYFEGDFGKALEYYIEAEQHGKNLKNDPIYAKILNNLASVYRNLDRFEDAIRIYQQSLALKKSLADSIGIANTLHNIGIAYAHIKDHQKTIESFSAAKVIYKKLEEWGEAESVNWALAVAYHEMGQEEEAESLLTQAFESGNFNVNVNTFLQGKLLLAKIYVDQKKYSSSNTILKEIEPIIINTNFTKSLQLFYELRAHTLYGLGNYQDAFLDLQVHTKLKDSLRSAERIELEKEMEAKYLTKEKETQIQVQSLQIQKSKRERLIYILSLVASVLILGFGYWYFRQSQKVNKILNVKNAQIQKALDEKEVLLKEIHHRVKNNLQIISSLLSLQSRQIEDPRALAAIQEGRNRVNSMALIHKNLYQDENLVAVNMIDYIDKLTDSLVSNYSINLEKVAIEKNIDPLKLDVDTIIPLGLILNELISNALKYAFAEGGQGKISMTLKEEMGGLRLQVADNGKGLPPNFDIENLKSLGFRLVKSFAQKLDAVLKVDSINGTNIDLFIPHQKGV